MLVLAAGGSVNKALPFIEDKTSGAPRYDAKAQLESVHAKDPSRTTGKISSECWI